MDDLISEFVAETHETLERIGDALLAWEANPADRSKLDEIFRFVHTVKGSCGFLNLDRIGALAHAAEDVLGTVRDGSRQADPSLVSAILAIIDRIANLSSALVANAQFGGDDDDSAILLALMEPSLAVPEMQAATPTQSSRNIRVGVDRLDQLMSEISDLVLARNALAQAMRATEVSADVGHALDQMTNRLNDLRDSIVAVRMQPVERLFAALPRLVRETARRLGKTVELLIDGSDVDIDREMIEQLRDPLIHVVRNAIDHGIERPEDRQRLGKPATGTLRIAARQRGNQVAIQISDDGHGIDIERLKARAIAAGILSTDRAARLSDDEAAQLIFAPGLSTALTVSDISGRGVGMDVVRANIDHLGGTIVLSSRPGQGLCVDLHVPLTLSVVPLMLVRAGDQLLALPRAVVREVFASTSTAIRLETLGDGRIMTVRDETMPVVLLPHIVADKQSSEAFLLVVELVAGARFALAVDSVGEIEDMVVKPVAPVLANIGLFAGQALTDAGVPVLVLDVRGVARLGQVDAAAVRQRGPDERAPGLRGASIILYTGLDGDLYGAPATVVDRIARLPREAFIQNGSQMFAHFDGALCRVVLDGELPDTGDIAVLLFRDGRDRLCYPVGDVLDFAQLDSALERGANIGLSGGVPVRLLDCHWLFGRNALDPANHVKKRQRALIQHNDAAWAEAVLGPLVTAAGYDVVINGDCADADFILVCDAPPQEGLSAPVIQLHRHAPPISPDSVHVYDAVGIGAALHGLAASRTHCA